MTATYYGKFKKGKEHPAYGVLKDDHVRAKLILKRIMPHYFNTSIKVRHLKTCTRYEALGSKFRDTSGTRRYLGLFATREEAETACRREKTRIITALMEYVDNYESGLPNFVSVDEIINPTNQII